MFFRPDFSFCFYASTSSFFYLYCSGNISNFLLFFSFFLVPERKWFFLRESIIPIMKSWNVINLIADEIHSIKIKTATAISILCLKNVLLLPAAPHSCFNCFDVVSNTFIDDKQG